MITHIDILIQCQISPVHFQLFVSFFFFTHNKYNLKNLPLKMGNKGMDLENKPLVWSLVAPARQSWQNRVVNQPAITWRLRSGKARVVVCGKQAQLGPVHLL